MAASSSSSSSSSESSSWDMLPRSPKRARTEQGGVQNAADVPESSTRRPSSTPNRPDALHVYLRELIGDVIDRVHGDEYRRTRNAPTSRLIKDAAVSLVYHAALLSERELAGVDFDYGPLRRAIENESRLRAELDDVKLAAARDKKEASDASSVQERQIEALREKVCKLEERVQQVLLDNDGLRLELWRSQEAMRKAAQELPGTARACTLPDEEVIKRVDEQRGGNPGDAQ